MAIVFSYALAKYLDAPLLFKGNDFSPNGYRIGYGIKEQEDFLHRPVQAFSHIPQTDPQKACYRPFADPH